MACRDGFRWNNKPDPYFHALETVNGYCFQLKNTRTNPVPRLTRCDNLGDIGMSLQSDYFTNKNQLPRPRPSPNPTIPLEAPEIGQYDTLCNKGGPNPYDFGDPNSPIIEQRAAVNLKFETAQGIFNRVCGCTTKKSKFKGCPGVGYYVRWKQRQGYRGGIEYDPQNEGIVTPTSGWNGAQVINEGTDDAYITYQYPIYAPIEVLGYYNYGATGFPQGCRQHFMGYHIQHSTSPIIDTQSILSFADNESARPATVNFGVGQYGGEDGIICGWKIEKIEFLRYRENIPGVRTFDIDEPDPLCPQFVPYPTPMPCQPLIIIIPCEEPKPEPTPDKPEPQLPCDDGLPICKNGIKATFICPEDELPPKPCPEVKPCDPCDKPEPCPAPKPCEPCDKPEPCPPGKPGSPPGIPGGSGSPPDKPEPCPPPKPCPPPDKPEPQRCADGSSPSCPEDDMKDCCDFSLIITEIQNTKLDLRLEINNSRLDIINNITKIDTKLIDIDNTLINLGIDIRADIKALGVAIGILLAQLKVELKVELKAILEANLQVILNAIAKLEINFNNNFDIKFAPVFEAINNLKVELALKIADDISLRFEPKFELVLNAIAKLEVNLIAKFEAVLNVRFELVLNAIAKLRADINIDFDNAINLKFAPQIKAEINNTIKAQFDLQLQLINKIVVDAQAKLSLEIGKIELNLKNYIDLKLGDIKIDFSPVLKLLSDLKIELGDIKFEFKPVIKILDDITITLKECCKDKGQDDLFTGTGTVTICDDENKDFKYTGKGLSGINKQVDSLIELVSYGITELSDKVCKISSGGGCATCYLAIKPSGIFNSNGDFQSSALAFDVPGKQPAQCSQILSFARSSAGSIWTQFNEAVEYYVRSFPQVPGEIKSDIERIGLTKNDAIYINKGLLGSGGIMEAFTAVTVISNIAQNTLSRLMIQPEPQKDGMVEIKVPDLFDGDGNLATKTKITVTNLSGEGYEDAAKEAEADLNKQWANFTTTIAKGLEDLTPPELADAGGGGAIVPKGKSDIEKFGLPITIIRFLNQALKFTGKGLLIQIAKTILENIIQDTLTRLLKGGDSEFIAFPIFHGEQNESIKVGTQLVLSFAVKEPKDSKEALSRWHLSIPNPVPCETLDWCKHFEPMERKIGNIMARVYWAEFTSNTYAYFESREHAKEFMTKLILPLSTSKPIDGNDGGPVRVTDNGSPKRKPRHRTIKCVEAIYVTIDSATGEPEKIACLRPPAQGCK